MSELAPPLAAEGLTQRLRHRTVLRGCTFAVPSGTTALLGPNGAGKTVLLRTLAGITPAVGGRVWLGGGDAAGPADLLHEVAYVPQFPGVHPRLTVRDHLERTARWRRIAGPRGSAEDAAERLGLSRWMHVAAGRLAPAQRHRLALAEAWVCRARIVLFDEPTADLDPEERAAFWSQAAALPAEAVVVTTHHFDEVQAHCRAALVLQGGRIRFAGAVADLAAAAEGCCFLLPPGAPGVAGCIVVGITPAGTEVLTSEPLAAPERPAGALDGYLHILGATAAAGVAAGRVGADEEVAAAGPESAEWEEWQETAGQENGAEQPKATLAGAAPRGAAEAGTAPARVTPEQGAPDVTGQRSTAHTAAAAADTTATGRAPHPAARNGTANATDPRPTGLPPTGSGSTGPRSTGPATTGPGSTNPGSTGPQSSGPAATGPGSTGPQSTGPAATGPGSTGPQSSGPGTTGPGATGPSSEASPAPDGRAPHPMPAAIAADGPAPDPTPPAAAAGTAAPAPAAAAPASRSGRARHPRPPAADTESATDGRSSPAPQSPADLEPAPEPTPEHAPAFEPAPQQALAPDSQPSGGRAPAALPERALHPEPGPQPDPAPELSLPPLGSRRRRRRGPRP